ncbi:MAG: phosphatidylglycerophosphatase A [Acidobacteria bacterium]|nr:phosphatidylglycerophosphatase A [Acidobacteriota bacterium]
MRNKLAFAIGTWFGCGYAPAARGTWGALAALVPAWLLVRYAGWLPWHFGLLAWAFLPVAIWAASRVARAVGKKDPSLVVVDEVVGQWMTLAGAAAWNWKSVLAAFVLFRLFDIWKPAPVRQLERLPGGIGINADDMMAGLYGALVLWAGGCFNLY